MNRISTDFYPMQLTDIPQIRLYNQLLVGSKCKTPQAVVEHMGALQAQDYEMAKWAVGVRMAGHPTSLAIEAALDKGDILRTHLLRPTWHLVSAEDIHWLLELTAPPILASQKWRHQQLGLDEAAIKKSRNIVEHAFKKEKQVARETLVQAFEEAGFVMSDNRASHLLFLAELEGIICSGETRGKKVTYALLSERAPKKKSISREEALAKLAHTYFTSRGPATLQDFTNWSGLTNKEAKRALDANNNALDSFQLGDHTFWLPKHSKMLHPKDACLLLPAFDEYIIAYKDRSAVLENDHHKTAVSSNGIFWPTIVLDGQVVGLWKRAVKKDKLLVELQPFDKKHKWPKALEEGAVAAFGDFMEAKAILQKVSS